MKTDLVVAGYIFDSDKLLLIYHKKLNKWLPVGGHIKKNETPDSALLREAKEETNLDIDILGQSSVPVIGSIERKLALPFHVDVHSVGDHHHCCFYYVCKALDSRNLKINDELKGARWFSREDLGEDCIPSDVKEQGSLAFDLYKRIK